MRRAETTRSPTQQQSSSSDRCSAGPALPRRSRPKPTPAAARARRSSTIKSNPPRPLNSARHRRSRSHPLAHQLLAASTPQDRGDRPTEPRTAAEAPSPRPRPAGGGGAASHRRLSVTLRPVSAPAAAAPPSSFLRLGRAVIASAACSGCGRIRGAHSRPFCQALS